MFHRDAQTNFTTPGTFNEEGFICSKYFKDQMSALMHMCEPKTKRSSQCGDYLQDVSKGGVKGNLDVPIANMTVGDTCVYRAFSRCGYPALDFDIQNDTLLQGFDVAFATLEGFDENQDIGGWNAQWTSKWNGSFVTNASSRFIHEDITEGLYSYMVDD